MSHRISSLLIVSALLGAGLPPGLPAQDTRRLQATRSELEANLAELEKYAASSGYSSRLRNEKAREGCMSVPDLTGDVKRATRLTVSGLLPGSGEEVTITTDAFEARALQHEIDHCAGLLFLDRVAGAHAVHPRKTYL